MVTVPPPNFYSHASMSRFFVFFKKLIAFNSKNSNYKVFKSILSIFFLIFKLSNEIISHMQIL